MNLTLQLCIIGCVLLFTIAIIRYLVLKKLNLKYTLVWLFTLVCMLVISIFPKSISYLADLIGVEVASNLAFFLAIMLLFLIVLTLTAIVSHMNNRVYRLAQKQAILEKRVRELEALISSEKKEDNK